VLQESWIGDPPRATPVRSEAWQLPIGAEPTLARGGKKKAVVQARDVYSQPRQEPTSTSEMEKEDRSCDG
jgi:hypothetical protein